MSSDEASGPRDYGEIRQKSSSTQITLGDVYRNHIILQQLERQIKNYLNQQGGQRPLFEKMQNPKPERFMVYVLRCDSPSCVETLEQRARSQKPYIPNRFYKAHQSNTIFYVGHTQRQPKKRLIEHLEGGERGADFTAVFTPSELFEAEWFNCDRQKAERKENKKAIELKNKYPDAFVYQY